MGRRTATLTHLLTVSESPMTVRERFGRVIATVFQRASVTMPCDVAATHTYSRDMRRLTQGSQPTGQGKGGR